MIPPPEERYFRHGANLALFRKLGDMRDHWDDQWMQQGSIKSFLESSRSGALGEFEHPFISYLPKKGTILEAGCGTGRYVCGLRARGYDMEGIDYAPETVKTILEIDPTLKIRLGDIFAIDRPDGYYSGYVSIGVLEHSFAGPMAGLREAFRVLSRGGCAIITVPQINAPRRRLWRAVPEAPAAVLPDGLTFYQDHIDSRLFRSQLEKVGFQVVDCIPYELYGGLIRDSKMGRYLKSRGFFHWRIGRFIRTLCRAAPRSLKSRYSHMIAFVCIR